MTRRQPNRDADFADMTDLMDPDALSVSGDIFTSFDEERKKLTKPNRACFGCKYGVNKTNTPGAEVVLEKLVEFYETNVLTMDFDCLVEEISQMYMDQLYTQECVAGEDFMEWPPEMIRTHFLLHDVNPRTMAHLQLREVRQKQMLVLDEWKTTAEGISEKACKWDEKYLQVGLKLMNQIQTMGVL